ncbi:MAG: ABC transporter permease [Paracoccaceae bacterium]
MPAPLTSDGYYAPVTSASNTPPQPVAALSANRRRFATGRAVFALMLREMGTRYGRSPGGYAWAILEPMGMIVVLSVAFSLLLRSPPLGNSFILFYATGFLPFFLYQQISLVVSRSIMFSQALLQYPAVTWVDAILGRFILNTLTGLLVIIILTTAILTLTETRTILEIGPIVLSLSLAMLLGLGVGTLNCVLIGLFDIWAQIWSIATRPLFLVSGIIYLYEDMPENVQELLWWNPLIHLIGIFRTGFYPSYTPKDISIAYVIFWGVITLFLGTVLMARYHRDILSNR